MLHKFLTNNRGELIARCRTKVATRKHVATAEQLQHGVPIFLDQLVDILRSEQADILPANQAKADLQDEMTHSEMGVSATLHGGDMLALGFTVDEVVHNYGDLCQAITELAAERDAPFSVDEFRTLNGCLDNAIAHAVTAFSCKHDFIEADRHDAEEHERMGFFVHELRNLLGTSSLAYAACKAGNLHLGGATGSILGRSLSGLESLISGTISAVRDENFHINRSLFLLADFVEEVEATAALSAIAKQCRFEVSPVDRQLAIQGNRSMLLAAVINLLQNAFKYTHPHTLVTLRCHAPVKNILIEVADHCGGIGADVAERMFLPFEQGDVDRTGLGLGLTIARQFIVDNGGRLSVRDVPGVGCVFTVELPRHSLPSGLT
jgi:signal transduction histidine kinase